MSTSRQRMAGHSRRRPNTAAGLRVPVSAPRWRLRQMRPAAGRDAQSPRNWSQALTSLIALGALVFTGVSVVQTGRQNTQQDNLAAQGQITDRYTAAVNQVGSTILDVRLGGIYALERIMRDSPADQPTIVEVLSAFVRDHPPGALTPSTRPVRALPLPTDVAAALTVLSRREIAHDGASVVDLRRTNFADVDLEGVVLTSANLTGANLTGAYLPSAHLMGANLTDADLSHADLTGADLTGADLIGAHLPHAGLILAHLTGAEMAGADLTDAQLPDANLTDADLSLANLTGAGMAGAHLTGADLTGADLTDADLTDADLTGAHASGTRLCDGSTPPRQKPGYRCDSP